MTEHEARWVTVAAIAFLVAATILIDVALFHYFGSDATISRVCGMAMKAYPILTVWTIFGLGLFVGHVLISAW